MFFRLVLEFEDSEIFLFFKTYFQRYNLALKATAEKIWTPEISSIS